MAMKPIETRWKGYRFRSRLEARWAVFFDTFGVSWEYEPEGYSCADGRGYLPDFLLGHDLLLEVKPAINQSKAYIAELAAARRKWSSFLATAPERQLLVVFGPPGGQDGMPRVMRFHADGHAERLMFAECRSCGALGFTLYDENGEPIDAELRCPPTCGSERWPVVGERIARAINAARSARFEHGEKGPA